MNRKKWVNDTKTKLRIFLERNFGITPSYMLSIPIFINNFNRLDTLKLLLESLTNRGYTNIIILDNQSCYEPLLEYYKSAPFKVIYHKKNYGSKSFWKSGLWLRYIFKYYCYTDSDLVLAQECPNDFMEHFYKLLKTNLKIHKVGFSLRIDNLPDHYDLKRQVIDWESTFWEKPTRFNTYEAPIDTTFAMYRPFSRRGKRDGTDLMWRTNVPYQAIHLPWYSNSKALTKEELYYKETTQESSWILKK